MLIYIYIYIYIYICIYVYKKHTPEREQGSQPGRRQKQLEYSIGYRKDFSDITLQESTRPKSSLSTHARERLPADIEFNRAQASSLLAPSTLCRSVESLSEAGLCEEGRSRPPTSCTRLSKKACSKLASLRAGGTD